MAVVERLPDELRNSQAGKTVVRDVRVRIQEDSSGQPALYIILVLANPAKGQATWPTDDLWALRRAAYDAKMRVEARHGDTSDLPWFVVFEPEKPAELEDEDLREVITLDDQ